MRSSRITLIFVRTQYGRLKVALLSWSSDSNDKEINFRVPSIVFVGARTMDGLGVDYGGAEQIALVLNETIDIVCCRMHSLSFRKGGYSIHGSFSLTCVKRRTKGDEPLQDVTRHLSQPHISRKESVDRRVECWIIMHPLAPERKICFNDVP